MHLLKDGCDVSQGWPALAVLRRVDILSWLDCVDVTIEGLYLRKSLSSLSAFVLSKVTSVWVDILLVFYRTAALQRHSFLICRDLRDALHLQTIRQYKQALTAEAFGPAEQGSFHDHGVADTFLCLEGQVDATACSACGNPT